MQTIKEFTSRIWYMNPITIIKWNELHNETNLAKIQNKAIFNGTPHDLRSVVYDNTNNLYVDGFGCIDGTIVITVH